MLENRTNTLSIQASKLRRLVKDHADLHKLGLPPNYIPNPAAADSSDLTALSLLLAGPDNTPYSNGVFSLELRMDNYPIAPPTAHFRTKLFHPNVDPTSGAVCVDTLKRDWKSELTLRDVLVTITCLLVCPNPASALNAEAGHLMEDDFAEFEHRAKMWSRIHASVPEHLREAVDEAKSRVFGEPNEASTTAAKGTKRRGTVESSISQLDEVENTPKRPIGQNGESRKTAQLALANNSSFDNNIPRTQERKGAVGLGLDNLDIGTPMDIDTPTQAPRRPSKKRFAMLPPVAGRGDDSPSFIQGQGSYISEAPNSSALLQSSPFPTNSSFLSTPTPPQIEPSLPDKLSLLTPDPRPTKRRRTHSLSPSADVPTSLPPSSTWLPRFDNPLLGQNEARDPESDPFSEEFRMPWLEWEGYLVKSVEPRPGASRTKDVQAARFGSQPRRGIFRL